MLSVSELQQLTRNRDGYPAFFWTPGPARVLYERQGGRLSRARHLRTHQDVMDFERGVGFSRARLRPPGSPDHPGFHTPWFTDGATHSAYRKVAKPPFHEARLPAYEDMIREVASDCVEDVRSQSGGLFNLTALTQTFALGVIGKILGAHGYEIGAFWQHLADITEHKDMNSYPDARGLTADLDRVIERERANPRGVIGEVAGKLAEPDAPPALIAHGVQDILRGLGMAGLFAGTDTLAMSIGNSFLEAQRRDLHRRLQWLARVGDLDELIASMQELMRLLPAFPASAQVADRDLELNSGLRLREGEKVVAWFTAANRDPLEFVDPLEFRAGRSGTPLIFGWFEHYCWGAALARLEMRILLPMMFERLPNLRPAPNGVRVRKAGRVNRLTDDPYVFDLAA